MNAADVTRFDELKRKRDISGLHPDSEAEYQALLERVIPGKDGLSEFPTETTEIVRAQQREVAAKQACSDVAEALVSAVAKHGPEVVAAVVAGLTKR